MSKYMNDSTYASQPGAVRLDLQKLKVFKKELPFRDRLFQRWRRICPDDMQAEHLGYGCCNPAVVIQTEPELIVAAYSSDHDWVLLLRFSEHFVQQYSLKPKTRLLAINVYGDGNEMACDLENGPNHSDNGWVNFFPKIAEFMSNDEEKIRQHKQIVASPEEWQRTYELGCQLLSEGKTVPRNGNPYYAFRPQRPRDRQTTIQPVSSVDAQAIQRKQNHILWLAFIGIVWGAVIIPVAFAALRKAQEEIPEATIRDVRFDRIVIESPEYKALQVVLLTSYPLSRLFSYYCLFVWFQYVRLLGYSRGASVGHVVLLLLPLVNLIMFLVMLQKGRRLVAECSPQQPLLGDVLGS